MYCKNCGKQIEQAASYCTHCGTAIEQNVLYHLPTAPNRSCDIQVLHDRVIFTGKFLYLRDKDFYRNKTPNETAFIKDFLGMGYLEKRSYRKMILCVFGAATLELVKAVVDKLGEWVDKANDYLKWVDAAIALPEWMNVTVNLMAFACLALGIALFFSKKKVIEISFTSKRICIPQKSLSKDEFFELRNVIKSLKE